MTNEPTIRELIDACRVNHNDPQRPELAAELDLLARELQLQPELKQAFDKSQRLDRSLRVALDDVAVPAGLADRMLAGCEAALVSPAKDEPVAEPAKSASRISRRQMISILSAAASLLIAIFGSWAFVDWAFAPRPISNEQLAMHAVEWFDQSGPAADWSTAAPPTQAFPLDSMVYRPSRWRYLEAKSNTQQPATAVYEMRHLGQRALLFVYQSRRPHDELASTPYTDLTASGGISLGAWKRGNVVYVLAVVGSNSRRPLEQFVRKPRQA
jgi:hypothetical protein